ncbi:MAG: MBL fold metallo-hydrolase [Chloroflexota bacterium]
MKSAVQVHPNVYAIACPFDGAGLVQCYYVMGAKRALIDTGVSTTPDEDLEPALRAVGLALSDVDFIINTHGHMDHLGGNHRAKEVSNAQILIHEIDAPFTRDPRLNVTSATTVPELVRRGRREDLLPNVEANVLRMVGKSAGVDRELRDGDRVDLGNDVVLSVIHTPGHTAGSCTFYWEKERLALSGDSIQVRGSRAGILPLYFLAREYMASQRRLLDLPIDLLCMGHNFNGSAASNAPIRRGGEAHATIREALAVAETIDRVVKSQHAADPDADVLTIAPHVLNELSYSLPILRDRADHASVPHRSLAPIIAHLEAARA